MENNILVIGIAGGTGSGKTTLMKRLWHCRWYRQRKNHFDEAAAGALWQRCHRPQP